MPARILEWRKSVTIFLLFVTTGLFISCASQKGSVALVNDPDAKPEGSIPWNRQEKWESQQGLGGASGIGGITDRR